jgi:hypothetical protein
MKRRSLFFFMFLTAVIAVGATLAVLSTVGPKESAPSERLVTFEVIITATTDVNATIPVKIITATPLPGQVLGLPTDLFPTPDFTTSPAATINPEIVSALPEIQSTAAALPPNCILHTIEEGDTPFGIAEKYGANGVDLMAVNGLTEETATQLRIGDVLIVPLEGCALKPKPTPTKAPGAAPTKRGKPEATVEVTSEFTFTPSPSPTITLAPTATNAQVSIVEVVGAGDITAEGVRIRNTGNTVNVAGWTLTDAQGNVYTFPEQQLFSNGEVTVYTRVGQNTPVALFWGRDQAVWGDPGDVVTLKDKDGKVQATLRLPAPVSLG